MPVFPLQIRHAFRSLLRTPGFTLLCILTLSVAIGANAAVFSVVDGILLRPLVYPRAERLVGLWHMAPGLNLEEMPQSVATYLFYREHSRVFEEIAAYQATEANLMAGELPERLPSAEVSASLFRALRISPRLGRTFTEEEEVPGAQPVVVLSNHLWRQRFGGDPHIVGKTVRIDEIESEVIGVMPQGFAFPQPETALWRPLKIDPTSAELGNFTITGLGRLSEGVSISSAQSDLNRLLGNLAQSFPGSSAAPVLARAGFAARVRPLRNDVVGDVGKVLWALLAAVGFVLLIACANVANLLLVRGEGRRREMAVYTALGAPRGRLIGGILAESLLLGLAAASIGLLLAFGGIRLLVRWGAVDLPRLQEVGVDGRVVAFTATLSILASLSFGLIPALRSTTERDLSAELKASGGRTATMGRSRRLTRQILLSVQVALALVLLTGSGLVLRSFFRLVNAHPGFEARDTLTFQLSLPDREYPNDASAARFFHEVIDRVATLPGVKSAGATSTLPLGGSAVSTGIEVEGFPLEEDAPPPVIQYEYISEAYFRALEIPLLAGRALERSDAEHRTGTVVINEALARRFWPGVSALGKRLRDAGGDPEEPWYRVVGVVGNIRSRTLTEEPLEIVYFPLLARSSGDWTVQEMSVVLRTRLEDPKSLANSVRQAIGAVSPHLPVANVRTMEEVVRQARARETFAVLMFLLSTAVALGLATVGLYGFSSFTVNQRTPEIGVRIAIGASAGAIRWMILKEALLVALLGVLAGLLGSVALTRWLRSLLFEVNPLDPVTFLATPLVLLATVLLASYFPAERATQVDPVTALQRYE